MTALMIKTPDCQSFQTAHSQAQSNRSAGGQFRSLDGALENATLMAESEDFKLHAARLRNEAKAGSKGWTTGARMGIEGKKDNSQFINQIAFCENHKWTLKLLQTRTKVLNNELEDVFRRWYPQFRIEEKAAA
jgi:hypothetical protein